ncbi:hypothetical protein ACMD2_15866 [Ananas comosus]|uniref:Uncharacterized protein n=1 Tax=Ananas comosus TaxID=4615 RepID=A0A199VYQ0_ANACO|nr:hypothetical protein ACMD2_15866 [Ananas comosus]
MLSTNAAVVIIADRTAATLHSGWAAFSSTATPLACGHAIDVPEITINSLASSVLPITDVGSVGIHDARMLSPGARMSGFNTPGKLADGPRNE